VGRCRVVEGGESTGAMASRVRDGSHSYDETLAGRTRISARVREGGGEPCSGGDERVDWEPCSGGDERVGCDSRVAE